MTTSPFVVYLADLTHTGQLVASNTHPLAIGLIAAYLKGKLADRVEIELFRYPADLSAALERRTPQVLGFSDYSWNCNLSYEYVRRVKRQQPETVIVFGGPNYGLVAEEQQAFWSRYPLVDFFVVKEGEAAMVKLLGALEEFAFSAAALKQAGVIVPSIHYFHDGRVVAGPLLPRFEDLNEIPSPYLVGLMDKFFDNVLIPMTYSTRGCPFTCTFCTEGLGYYNKVAKRNGLAADLDYMAHRTGTIQDLIITDANFGMFPEDVEKARSIAAIQQRHGWPRHIHVSGGKNKKERLLEVASIINGAMNVAASLQSTNRQVLENVKRANISLEQLNYVGKQGNRIDANTYAELILGLPGDSLEAHTQSIRDAVNAGLSFIRLYQLIMLLESDMNTPETRKRFGMLTKYRVMPRCFGTYRLYGEDFSALETEEICVAQDSLPFEDYVQARELDLTIEITHNVNMFRELFGLTRLFGLSWFDFLHRFHGKRRQYSSGLAGLYDTFREDTIRPLWASREELEAFAKDNLNRYLLDELGTNELFKAKAIAFFRLQEELHHALYAEMESLLSDLGHMDAGLHHYLVELKRFSLFRKRDLLDSAGEFRDTFSYDFEKLSDSDFNLVPGDSRLDHPRAYVFRHSAVQREMIAGYIHQYGTTVVGLGRILMRSHVKRLFREVQVEGETIGSGPDNTYRRALNLYGD
jgi:radical SAM superfamily enzyme YgiQ (UPF0313 family)